MFSLSFSNSKTSFYVFQLNGNKYLLIDWIHKHTLMLGTFYKTKIFTSKSPYARKRNTESSIYKHSASKEDVMFGQ